MRAFDMVLAIVGMVLLAPVFLVLALLGYLFIGRPVFTQTRVGKNGRLFTLIKFRTMPEDTPDLPTHLVDTQSIPLYGRILRKTRLDETPQLINVILGDMSLVGPRPCLPQQKELLAERASRGVDRVKPGITGLAQICGVDMSSPKRLARYDALMLENLNLARSLTILIFTALRLNPGRRLHRIEPTAAPSRRLAAVPQLAREHLRQAVQSGNAEWMHTAACFSENH